MIREGAEYDVLVVGGAGVDIRRPSAATRFTARRVPAGEVSGAKGTSPSAGSSRTCEPGQSSPTQSITPTSSPSARARGPRSRGVPGPLLDRADLHQVGERNRQGGDAYDPGLADQHREFALRCDLVFFSAAAAGDNTPALMREILREGRADTVVATAGAEGSCLLTRDGRFGALAGTHACTAPVATEPISRKSLLAAYQIA